MTCDELHIKINGCQYKRAIDDADTIIGRAVKMASHPAVAVSGGKDSVAMAHLVAQHCRPAIIWNDSGMELPESGAVVAETAAIIGLDFYVAKGNAEAAWMRSDNASSVDRDAIINPTIALLDELGIDLEFVGLREAESRNRRMLIRTHGPIHQSKRWGRLLAWPMRRWTGADCLAYIYQHGLPLHPAYSREPEENRENVRVSWIYDDQWAADGSAEICRRQYPKIYHKLKTEGIIQ